jgi:hypothetical protein
MLKPLRSVVLKKESASQAQRRQEYLKILIPLCASVSWWLKYLAKKTEYLSVRK